MLDKKCHDGPDGNSKSVGKSVDKTNPLDKVGVNYARYGGGNASM
jgi:hypothetical protein